MLSNVQLIYIYIYIPCHTHRYAPFNLTMRMHADTVIAPGPSSQAIAQMALGGIFFDSTLASAKPSSTGQASGCVTKSMSTKSASSLLFRQLMCALPSSESTAAEMSACLAIPTPACWPAFSAAGRGCYSAWR